MRASRVVGGTMPPALQRRLGTQRPFSLCRGAALDEDLSFQYTDTNDTVMKVLRRTVQTGDAWSVPQGGWTGCIMLGDLAAA